MGQKVVVRKKYRIKKNGKSKRVAVRKSTKRRKK